MQRANCLVLSTFLGLACGLQSTAMADPAVWSGLTKIFSKPAFVEPQLPEYQDWITPNVALTRSSSGGIYNAADEEFYESTSPAGTLWATDLNNPGKQISAANWAELTFDTWVVAYGGSTIAGTNVVPVGGPPRNAVVQLVTDQIVLDLQFTSWGGRGEGGFFSYLRSEAVPEPASATLFFAAFVGLCLHPRRRAKA